MICRGGSSGAAALGLGGLTALLAVLGGAGCGALLDLDVQYKDGGADAAASGSASTGTSSGGGSGASTGTSSGAGSGDTSGEDEASSGQMADATTTPDAPVSLPDASPAADAPFDGSGANLPHYVQSAFGATDMVNVGVSVTMTNPVGQGSTIVVAVEVNSDNSVTLVDSLSGSWQRAGFVPAAAVFGYRTEVWYALGVHAGAETVSASFPGETAASDTIAIYVHEYAGISAFDVAAVGHGDAGGSQGDMVTTAMMTTAPNDLLFAFGSTSAAIAGTGFTPRRMDMSDLSEDRIVPQPSSVSATATSLGQQWALIGVAFKAL
jgi:hypothetical protein